MEILKPLCLAGLAALLIVSCEGGVNIDIKPVVPPEDKDTSGVVDPPKDTVKVSATTRVWYEIPVITDADRNGIDDDNPDLYYAYHLCDLKSPSGHKARNYAVCFSAEHQCPYWVSAPRHNMYSNKVVDRTKA